jgi:GTP-binding protein
MAIFVLDVADGLTVQDSKIIEEIIYNQNSLIIVANKWDKIEDKDTKKYTNEIYAKLPFAAWAPIQFVSALSGAKVNKVLDLIIEIKNNRKLKLSESQLDKLLKASIKKHRPVKGRGTKHPYIHKLKQVKVDPPKFEIKIGSKDSLLPSYARFIENRIRIKYGFSGTPIGIRVVKNKKIHGQHEQFIKNQD